MGRVLSKSSPSSSQKPLVALICMLCLFLCIQIRTLVQIKKTMPLSQLLLSIHLYILLPKSYKASGNIMEMSVPWTWTKTKIRAKMEYLIISVMFVTYHLIELLIAVMYLFLIYWNAKLHLSLIITNVINLCIIYSFVHLIFCFIAIKKNSFSCQGIL